MKKYFVLGGFIVIAGVLINYILGGFDPLNAEVVEQPAMVLYGWPYEGSYKSAALDEQVEKLRQMVQQSPDSGTLTIVNYLQPELEKKGMVRQFTGIVWQQRQTGTGAMDTLQLAGGEAIRFRLKIRPLIMPTPEKLTRLAASKAAQMESTLAGYSIEQYVNDALIVTFPLKTTLE